MALVLASCGGGNTPQAECDRAAMQDPAVQDIYARSNGNYTFQASQTYADLEQAKRQAVLRCMRLMFFMALLLVSDVAMDLFEHLRIR